jgi:hypothetical protein
MHILNFITGTLTIEMTLSFNRIFSIIFLIDDFDGFFFRKSPSFRKILSKKFPANNFLHQDQSYP